MTSSRRSSAGGRIVRITRCTKRNYRGKKLRVGGIVISTREVEPWCHFSPLGCVDHFEPNPVRVRQARVMPVPIHRSVPVRTISVSLAAHCGSRLKNEIRVVQNLRRITDAMTDMETGGPPIESFTRLASERSERSLEDEKDPDPGNMTGTVAFACEDLSFVCLPLVESRLIWSPPHNREDDANP